MYQDRYVPLPAGLLAEVEVVERPEVVDTVALGAALKACLVRTRQANGQLREIAGIQPEGE